MGPIPRLIDLITLVIKASVLSERGSLMLSRCSCWALRKQFLEDLYFPCFMDAPIASTSSSVMGIGSRPHACAIVHQVFHCDPLGSCVEAA